LWLGLRRFGLRRSRRLLRTGAFGTRGDTQALDRRGFRGLFGRRGRRLLGAGPLRTARDAESRDGLGLPLGGSGCGRRGLGLALGLALGLLLSRERSSPALRFGGNETVLVSIEANSS